MGIFSKTTLADFDGNRRNNFTLIRITFAWLVLYGHSYAVQNVVGIRDPLNQLFQGSLWVGELAVNGFFAISGFLVTASLVKRNILDYTISRFLRIFPALFVCVFASTFILGPWMTSLSTAEYFSQSATFKYLTNAIAFYKMRWTLPGVFEDNIRNAINGSLWTLTVEVRCYFLLALAGACGLLRNQLIANLSIIALFLFGYGYFSEFPLLGQNAKWSRPGLFFLMGVFLFINRRHVILDGRIALFALFCVAYSFGKEWFNYVFPVGFVYLIFYVTYVPNYLPIDEYVGDISYGIYIYAWPIQQLVAHYMPQGNPYTNTFLASLITIPLALLSWHALEKHMLGYKKILLNRYDVKRLAQVRVNLAGLFR